MIDPCYTPIRFTKIKLNYEIFSELHNRFLIVECIDFLEHGIVWLRDNHRTYPHTLKYINLTKRKCTQ